MSLSFRFLTETFYALLIPTMHGMGSRTEPIRYGLPACVLGKGLTTHLKKQRDTICHTGLQK